MQDSVLKSLSEQVAEAYHSGSQISITGSGSKHRLFSPAKGQQLDMTCCQGLLSYDPTELVMRVGAGMAITELEQVLAENQQALAFEPPLVEGRGTVGGMIATALAGPRRPFSGAVRDYVLGLGLINGKGERLNFGGQVMKNVAGYDVSRLLVGSFGELGAITEVSLKVLPASEFVCTYAAQLSMTETLKLVKVLQRKMTPITGVSHSEGIAYIRMAGRQETVERFAASQSWRIEMSQQASYACYWQALRDFSLSVFESQQDTSVYCLSLPKFSACAIQSEGLLMDWAGARYWLRIDNDDESGLQALQQEAERLGGFVRIFGSGSDAHLLPEPVQVLQRKLKKVYDPAGIMNAGVLFD